MNDTSKTKLTDLYLTFAKIGVMTIGGGLTMLPLLERELVRNKKWTTEDELLDYYAIAQCTPGIIAVNTATFVGSKERKTAGGIVATLGMVTPSVVIILIIASFLSRFSAYPVVQNAFLGIRAAVCALMLNTVVKLAKKSVKDRITGIISVLVFVGMTFLDISPIVYVLTAGAVGILFRLQEKADIRPAKPAMDKQKTDGTSGSEMKAKDTKTQEIKPENTDEKTHDGDLPDRKEERSGTEKESRPEGTEETAE